jgi:hypothetical protein
MRVKGTVGRHALTRASVAVMVTTLIVLAGASASADAGGVKAMWGPGFRDGASQFPVFRELGVKVYEDLLRWDEISTRRPRHARNPHDRAYRWPAEVTRSVAEAKRYGIQVALEIIGSPRWANGNRPPKWVPRRKSYYSDFAVAAARRYPSVHLWMIWGEPSRSRNFRPLTPARPGDILDAHQKIAPHVYARLLDKAYAALKAENPNNIVIGGMTDPAASITPVQWIENLRLPDGKPPRMDMYGHNPFSLRAPDLSNEPAINEQLDFSDVARLHDLVDKNLGTPQNPEPKLFLSEWTIPTAADREFNYHVGQPLQATWISDGLHIVRSLPFIYALGWIHLYDELPVYAGGLIKSDGRRKLGFYAWKNG